MAAALQSWIRALESVGPMQRDKTLTLPGMLDGLAARYGERIALLGCGQTITYAELARRVDAIARWAHAEYPGATIGLLLPNRPEYVALWLGLTRGGCVVALLNHNLVGEAMRHAVRAASCTAVIAGAEQAGFEVPILAAFRVGNADGPLPPMPEQSATALLVYTSGTTGLPKAARVTHARVIEWALWFAGMMDVGPDDRLYDCLPLYHSTGGIVAVGASLVRGASVLIAPGFSASGFWDDVVEGGCTIFFYIGELCRYLLRTKPDHRHRLRLACGNGLQAEVWEAFRDRFVIPQILEFYAATEGGVSLYNCEGRPGAIGRVPPFLQSRFPLALVRIEGAGPVRGADGYCVRCGPGEPGEALGRIHDARRFDGYTDADASSQKLLHGVFEPGDRWFRSGDLMRQDRAGFYYFVDRIGDTFRWKGENVSTGEVAAVVRSAPWVDDAVVYGVRVPGQEGRAGMAALVVGEGFELGALHGHLDARLPAYAQPVFVRLCRSLDMTGTFKLSAARLAGEGFAGLGDPVFVRTRHEYLACDEAVVAGIIEGTLRI